MDQDQELDNLDCVWDATKFETMDVTVHIDLWMLSSCGRFR